MKLKTLLLSAFLAGASIFGCRDPTSNPSQSTGEYTLNNFSDYTLSSGYERPSGLSTPNNLNSRSSKSRSYSNLDNIVDSSPENMFFIESPTINPSRTNYIITPKIYKTLSGGDTEIIYNFGIDDIDKFVSDNPNNLIFEDNETPLGLKLSALVMQDGSILCSSNLSDEISRIHDDDGNTIYEKQIYLKNPELIGITDMKFMDNGLIYLAQSNIVSQSFPTKIIRPKMVRSLNYSNKSLSLIANLPDGDINDIQKIFFDSTFYGSVALPIHEELKITENSLEGKISNGYEFFAIDVLSNIIYGVKENNSVSTISNEINNPTSMAVLEDGNILVSSSPLFLLGEDGNPSTFIPTGLMMLNPLDRTYSNLYVMTESSNEYELSLYRHSDIDGTDYLIPSGFTISSVLFEDDSSIQLYLTNSHTGQFNLVTAIKEEEIPLEE